MAQSVRFLLISLVFWALTTTLLACGDDMQARGPYKDGFNPAFTGKLGSRVRLESPADVGFEMRRTIVDMNINDFNPDMVFDSGAWIVTLNQNILTPLPGSLANPLLARVTWGEGGATTEADISIGPGTSFQVAAGQVRVDVWLEDSVPAPTLQEVRGFIKRGSLSIGTRRTYYINPPIAPGPAIEAPIPNFANSVLLYSPNLIAASGLPTYDPLNTLAFYTGSTTLAAYSGDQLYNATLAGSPLAIPAGATSWNFVAAVPIVAMPTIEFFLDF